MSELQKAKQRLLLRSSSIMEAAEQDSELKLFKKTGNTASIPKLTRNLNPPMNTYRDRSISQLQLQDHEHEEHYYEMQGKRMSPGFAKTDRGAGNLFKSQRFDAMSEHAQHITLFDRKITKTRRITEYSRASSFIGNPDNMSFTENERSVYNESPEKAVKMTVHNDKLNLIITKMPTRKALSPFKPKQCLLEYLQSQLKENQPSNNTLFIDDMFPPRFTIIFNKKYMYLEEGLKLERLTKIYEGQQVRLIKFCEPTLIIAGKYTSPAMYCALAILAEEPTRVFNILGNQEYNENGMYYAQICKDGVWRYLVIDDYLPVKILAKRSLLFAHTLTRNGIVEFWPAIVEKALAKMYGTYQDIFLTANRGIKDILRAMTGYPVSEYRINKDFRAFLIIIDAAVKRKQIVVLESIPQQYHETAHLKGLNPQHSYQIVQVKKTYVALRNLSDRQLITKLTFEQAMIFTKLLIFRSETGYTYISRTLRHKRKCYSILRVRVGEGTKCYWDVWENSEVYYKNHIGSHIEYQRSRYAVRIKRAAQGTNYDSEPQEEVVQAGKEVAMQAGEYYLFVHLCQLREQDFTVSYYGEREVEIERVKNMAAWEEECEC